MENVRVAFAFSCVIQVKATWTETHHRAGHSVIFPIKQQQNRMKPET